MSTDPAGAPVGTPLANGGMPTADRRCARDVALLACLAALTLALPLLVPPITHHGEAREGLVVQDLVAGRHWILPRRNGELPSKPPLFHWSAALATTVFGPGDATLRLPSAAAGIATLGAVFALGTAIGGRAAGALASLVLLGMAPFVASATEARVDMLFAAAIAVALVAFRLWDLRRSPGARALAYAAVVAAVLTKGPAGAALPALVILAFLASERRLATLRDFVDWRLALAAAAVAGGWYALAIADGGRAFVRLQLVHENLQRAFGGPTYGKSGRHGAGRLAWSLFAGLLPWSLVLPAALAARLGGRRGDAHARFLHTWWIVVFAVFALAAGKRAVYLLPAAPAIALLAGRALAAVLAPGSDGDAHVPGRAWIRAHAPPTWTVLATLVLVAVATSLVLTGTRLRRAERGSLVAFADGVRREVPADASLCAARDLGRDETLVLAYRLARALPRERQGRDHGAYALVPAADVAARTAAGWSVVAASSRRRGADVALVRAPVATADSAAFCRPPQGLAGSGACPPPPAESTVSTEVAVPRSR